MALFVYAGDPDRFYPDLRLSPKPGACYELDFCPSDGRWLRKPDASAAPVPASTAVNAAAAAAAPIPETK